MNERPPNADGARSGNAADAILRVGAGLAKVASRAVTGREPPQRADESPVQELFRHSTTVAGTLIALTVNAAREAGLGTSRQERAEAGEGPGAPANTQAPNEAEKPGGAVVLQVERGAELRIPFSIDNRGAEPILGIEPKLIDMLDEAGTPSTALDVDFEPRELDIAPHDFEKLVVRIAAGKQAEPGQYLVRITMGDDPIELAIMLL